MTLPPLPKPSVGLGVHHWAYSPEDMRDYATAAVQAYREDAERYRWLKSRKGLDLRTEHDHCVWTRIDGSKFCATHYLAEGGTQHAPADSLDATIDAAMVAAAIRARKETK